MILMMMIMIHDSCSRREENQQQVWSKACGDSEPRVIGFFSFLKWYGDCDDAMMMMMIMLVRRMKVVIVLKTIMIITTMIRTFIIMMLEVDDHSTRPLANGAVSKASWPTQILARCQILNKGTWHYSDDWAILKFFPMTDPMIDPMTGPKAGSLKKKFWILKNASIFCVTCIDTRICFRKEVLLKYRS